MAGFKLPPMMFTDDEALALSVGLLAARGVALPEAAPAAESARAKLERIMPANLKWRVRALSQTVRLDLAGAWPPAAASPAAQDALFALSAAALAQQRVLLHDQGADGQRSAREVDPYGLALRGGSWYLVGMCQLRGALRSFRLDRIATVAALPMSFGRPAGFDALAHLRESMAAMPRAHAIAVLLKTDLDAASRHFFDEIGFFEPVADGVLLRSQADDLDWFARQLCAAPFDAEIIAPEALRASVAALAGRMLRMARPLCYAASTLTRENYSMSQHLNTVGRHTLAERDIRRIREHAQAADAAGFLAPVQQALVHRRGWLRMLAPRAAGGAGLALPAAVRLEEQIASIDGSMGWAVTLCAGAGWFAGFLPPALARDIIGTKRVCIAGSGAPTGYADVDGDGDGYRISGRWDYASGAPMATHFTLNAILRRDGQPLLDSAGAARIRAFILPARAVEVVPSWGSIGLRATASHSYRVHDQWIGAEHGFAIDAAHATDPGPLYRFPFFSLAFVTLAANLAGMAAHFLQLATPAISRRRHPLSGLQLIDVPGVRARLDSAADELDTARMHFYRLLDDAWAHVLAGSIVGPAEAAALQAASLGLVSVARRAVDELYPYCGLYAANPQSEINRVWRDFHTATQHTLLLP